MQVGDAFTYRFVADHAGTFWYHSHQLSQEQVRGGLLGGLVIAPKRTGPAVTDVLALFHTYAGARTVNGVEGDVQVQARPGRVVRLRVVNTENGPVSVWVARAPFRLVAVDGTELNEPDEVQDSAVVVTAGGRADLQITMPADASPVRVQIGGPAGVVLGSSSYNAPSVPRPGPSLDLLSYGEPAPLGFDPGAADRGSSTRSGGGQASWTADRGCGGASTATCSRTPRVTWSRVATWYG